MKLLEPEDYGTFRCAASECPDTCCAAWEVIIDARTKAYYDQMPGRFGACVRDAMVFRDNAWMFRTKNGRCPLLTYDALCSLQLRCGEKHLCDTCREYPGFVSEYGLYRERGHSLSCPEAARRLYERTEPLRLVSYETDEPLNGCNSIDAELFFNLRRARETALQMVQNRCFPVHKRLQLLLAFAEALQLCIDEGRLSDMPELCAQYAAHQPIAKRPAPAAGLLRTELLWARFFGRMEVLRPEWQQRLADLETALQAGGRRHPQVPELLGGIAQEQLLSYYVYKFFLRSAYCGDVLVKAKLIAVCFVMIGLLDWANRPVQPWENAYRFARELEHSEENLARLEHWLKHAPRFRAERILELLN